MLPVPTGAPVRPARPRRRARIGAVAAAAALLLGACGLGDDADPRPTYTSTSGPDGGDPTSPAFPMPDTPVGEQAQWIVDRIADDGGPTADDAAGHLSDDLIAGTGDDGPESLFDRARAAGPFQPVDLDVVGTEAVLRLRSTTPGTPSVAPSVPPSVPPSDDPSAPPADGTGSSSASSAATTDWRVVFALDGDDRIDRLTIARDDGIPAPTTWAELLEQLTRYDAEVSMFAARVVDGRCEPVAAVDADRRRPIASTFKLWVLETVARAVEAGTLAWNDRLTVDDDVRSLPSGSLQDEPNGHRVSVSQTAAGMIAVSDNTGADMLIRTVGRDAVEETVRATEHGAPELNIPFLTTREFFTIGWGPGGELLDAWIDAGDDPDARRSVVDDVPAGPLTVTAEDIDDPVWQHGLDWFASTEDICQVMVALHDRPAGDPDTQMLRTILGHNRGVDIDEGVWPYVAFKGGSARGVLAGSWLGEREDGERYFFAVQAAADTTDAVRARDRFYGLAEYGFGLLAAAPAE